jgi:hypothetical protein
MTEMVTLNRFSESPCGWRGRQRARNSPLAKPDESPYRGRPYSVRLGGPKALSHTLREPLPPLTLVLTRRFGCRVGTSRGLQPPQPTPFRSTNGSTPSISLRGNPIQCWPPADRSGEQLRRPHVVAWRTATIPRSDDHGLPFSELNRERWYAPASPGDCPEPGPSWGG